MYSPNIFEILSIVGHLIKLAFKVITLNNLVEVMSIRRLNYNVYDLFRIGKKTYEKIIIQNLVSLYLVVCSSMISNDIVL